MMKRVVRITAISIAMSMFIYDMADATLYRPVGHTEFGSLSMGACRVGFTLAVLDRGDQAQVTSVIMKGPPDCSGVVFHDLPYAVRFSNGTLTISNMSASFKKMDVSCAGSITGSWDAAAQKLTFANQSLPGKNGGCGIKGVASPDHHFEIRDR